MRLSQAQEILYNEIPDIKVIYYIMTGLSYRKIGVKFYGYRTGKFVYQVRKLLKHFNLLNRRQLAYFAVKNNLVSYDKLKEYIGA